MPQKKYTTENKVLRKKLQSFLILNGMILVLSFIISTPAFAATSADVNATPNTDEKNLLDDVTGIAPRIPSIKTIKFPTAVEIDQSSDHIFKKLAGATAYAEAYYAGNTQTLGILPGASGGAFGAFVPLFPVSGSKGLLADTPSAAILLPDDTLFRFALDTTPFNAAKYSSDPIDNPLGSDQMLTFYDPFAKEFWFAWEDQIMGSSFFDEDYNDFVVKVTHIELATIIPELPKGWESILFIIMSGIILFIRSHFQVKFPNEFGVRALHLTI